MLITFEHTANLQSPRTANMITDVLKQQPEYTTFLYFAFVSVPLVLFCLTSSGPGLYKGFPAVGVDDRDGRFGRIDKARKRWMQHGASIVQEGFEKVGLNSSQAWQMLTFSIFVLKFPKCFQVVTGAGPRIVLSGRYADEIRNEPNLDFRMSNSIVSAPHAYTDSEYYTFEYTNNLT